MLLKKINALNFRNYEELHLEFDLSRPLNFIVSSNGMGKSNLLEIIYYLSYLRSFRNVNDKEVLKKGKDFFFIECGFNINSVNNNIKIKYHNKKQLTFNDKKVKKFSDVLGKLITVLFSNEDVFIINGSPFLRRRFFDIFISVTDTKYLYYLKRYQEIIRQKNCLLKDQNKKDLVEIFNLQLVEIIHYLQNKRSEMTNNINGLFQEIFNVLGLFKEKVKIIYSPSIKGSFEDEEYIRTELNRNLKREYTRGYALIGPHRDNYLFLMNGVPFSKFASLGQTRLASLVLKFVQAEYFKELFKTYPILLLDDVILELDREKQKRFIKKISDYRQIFITVTNDEYVNLFNDKEMINKIRIENGKIK